MEPTQTDLPPCMIFIDKEGRMWHEGAEMIHPGINELLLEHLALEGETYVIEFRGQRCFVEVEDTALVVQRVVGQGEEPDGLSLTTSDGRTEELNPALLWITDENVIYTKVREGSLPARFTRQAYYQLAEYIVEADQGFALKLGGKLHHLVTQPPQ